MLTPLRHLAVFTALAGCVLAQHRDIPAGPWSKNKIPDGWVVIETRNYFIQSQAGKEKAERLGDHMEVMNKVYRQLFRPDKEGAKKQVVKLFKDRQSYLGYGAPPSSAAYYSRSDREMVCYDTGKWSDEVKPAAAITGDKKDPLEALKRRLAGIDDMMKMDILGCAAHEGWHQYFSWLVVSFVELPSWINEGMGDYFYTAAPRDDASRSKPATLGGMNNGRLMVLKAAVRQNRLVPLAKLLKMSKAEFYADASVCYAEGWALCQFLLHGADGKYDKIIPKFISYVRNDTNMAAVTERAFKGIDIDALDAEFRAWIDTLKLPKEDDPDLAEEEPDGGK